MKTFCVLALLLLSCDCAYGAQVTLPYSQSFTGCSQDTDYPADGWACGTNNTAYSSVNRGACTGNGYQQVSAAANDPGGAGGRGWRRWICSGNPAPTTGSLSIGFAAQRELWIRFNVRRQPGMAWGPLTQEKLFFLRFPAGQSTGQSVGVLEGWDSCLMWATHGWGADQTKGGNNNVWCNNPGAGWDTMHAKGPTDPATGHKISDGSWHSMELHVKMESAAGLFDGEFDMWIDGVRVGHNTAVNYSGFSGIHLVGPRWRSQRISGQ